MSYVDDNLTKNEKVLFLAHVSSAVFLRSLFSAILAMSVSLLYFFNRSVLATKPGERLLLITVTVCFAFIAIVQTLQATIRFVTTEFAITNRRLIAKTGFIRRHTVEMLLMKVESVSVNQSIFGRIFDFGTIIITGTGGTREGFRVIAEPLEVRKKVNEILESYLRAYSTYQQSKAVEQDQV